MADDHNLRRAFDARKEGAPASLRPVIGTGLLTLYGLGTTVGAGIYALIGKVSATAGYYAPVCFLLCACVAGLSALSFAELSARFPKAAGAALYVQQGLGNINIARVVGLCTVLAGLVSSAALLNGFVGYLNEFVDAHRLVVIGAASASIFLLAAWGVGQSLKVAAVITLVEVGGLVAVVAVNGDSLGHVSDVWAAAPKDIDVWMPILFGTVLAFYAYIGFEDMVDLAEEVKDVGRTMPRAIAATLGLTTLLYTSVAIVAVLALPLDVLAESEAPMALLFENGGGNPLVLSGVALFAIVNGALVQVIMASRVLYGLASRDQLPKLFAKVNARTRTPVIATAFSAGCVVVFASLGELTGLAKTTSLLLLGIFALVNYSLWRIKRRERADAGVPRFLAMTGCVTCVLLILSELMF